MKRLIQFWTWVRTIKPQSAIATLCFGIVFARFFWPDLKFDNLSLYLILVAMLCILVPDLARLIGRIRKLKIGDKEIELGEAIDRLSKETENAEERVSSATAEQFEREGEPSAHIERYVRDPRGGLIAIAADIESRVQLLIRKHQLVESQRYITPMRGIELLAQRGLVVQELPMLMRDFWTVRNKVVHDSDVRMTERDIYRLVDLGVRILDLLTVRKKG